MSDKNKLDVFFLCFGSSFVYICIQKNKCTFCQPIHDNHDTLANSIGFFFFLFNFIIFCLLMVIWWGLIAANVTIAACAESWCRIDWRGTKFIMLSFSKASVAARLFAWILTCGNWIWFKLIIFRCCTELKLYLIEFGDYHCKPEPIFSTTWIFTWNDDPNPRLVYYTDIYNYYNTDIYNYYYNKYL